MAQSLSRRATLAGLGASLAAGPALARPPFRLRGEGKPLLSPPIISEDGSTGKLADFAGKVILLNIWATWCPPCREEMPAHDRLHGRLAGPDFMVLPLCIDDTGIQRGRRFFDEIGIRYLPLFWAEYLRVQLAFAVIGLPTTLLVNRQSQEIGRIPGPYDWDSDEAARQILGSLA